MSKKSDIISAYAAIIVGFFLILYWTAQTLTFFRVVQIIFIIPLYLLLSVIFLLYVHYKYRDKR